MPLDPPFQLGLVLVALVVAFAISAAVGVVLAWLYSTPSPLRRAAESPASASSRPDSTPVVPVERRRAEALTEVNNPVF